MKNLKASDRKPRASNLSDLRRLSPSEQMLSAQFNQRKREVRRREERNNL